MIKQINRNDVPESVKVIRESFATVAGEISFSKRDLNIMYKINIMTWNVDWFRNGKHTRENDSIYDFNDCSLKACNSIILVVKSFLEEENSIVFLQEVPYMKFNQCRRMVKHELWDVFYDAFSEEEYNIFRIRRKVLRYTIAIAKKNVFEKIDCLIDNNRVIGVQNDCVELVGVHMPTHFKLNDDNDKMWTNLIDYVEASKGNLILAGDFNAFIGCTEKLTEQRYLELLKYMGNCVSENIITYGITSIDKIMLKKGSYFNSAQYKIVPQKSKEFSDHKYIIMELVIENEIEMK